MRKDTAAQTNNLHQALASYYNQQVAAARASAAEHRKVGSRRGCMPVDAVARVEVTPKSIGPGAPLWDFSVELHTHSSGASDDLTQSAVLVTDDGRTLKPLGWSDTKLGPHREGVLSFEAPAPLPRTFELRITRPGEAAPRSFRWQL